MKQNLTRQRLFEAIFKLPDQGGQISLRSFSMALRVTQPALTHYIRELREASIIRTHELGSAGTGITILNRAELQRRVEGVRANLGDSGRLDEVQANRPVSLVAKT